MVTTLACNSQIGIVAYFVGFCFPSMFSLIKIETPPLPVIDVSTRRIDGAVCTVDASVVQFARAVRTWKSGFALQLEVSSPSVCNWN